LSVGDIRSQIAAVWLQIAQCAVVTMESLQETTIALSNATITHPCDLPFPQMGVPSTSEDQRCDACCHLVNRRCPQDFFLHTTAPPSNVAFTFVNCFFPCFICSEFNDNMMWLVMHCEVIGYRDTDDKQLLNKELFKWRVNYVKDSVTNSDTRGKEGTATDVWYETLQSTWCNVMQMWWRANDGLVECCGICDCRSVRHCGVTSCCPSTTISVNTLQRQTAQTKASCQPRFAGNI